LREAVRYTGKNLRWTANDFNTYCNSHASALLDLEFKAGETIIVWLPESAEKHVVMMAAAKIGMKVVDVDLDVTELSAVRSFLAETKPKAIYFKPQHEDADYLLLLRKAIPEFFEYDDSHGQMFHSKYYPTLKYFIHTGFDIENGCLNFKNLFLANPTETLLEQAVAAGSDDAVIYQPISKGGAGAPTAAGKVADLPSWSFAKRMISHEYFETA